MPGPYGSGVLDDFNTGAAQNLTSRTGWAAGVQWTGEPTLVTDGVPTGAAAVGASTWGSNYWAASLADCEAWLTIEAFGTGDQSWDLSTRVQNPGATPNDYEFTFNTLPGLATNWQLDRYDAGAVTNLVAPTALAAPAAAGDSFALASLGATHTTWWRPAAGSWTLLTTIIDATYASGFLGLQGRWATTSGSITEFGGGAVSTALQRRIGAWSTRSGGA